MDKIFVAMENKVLGFNKKKKLFFQLEMNAAESIKSMWVCTAACRHKQKKNLET